jgi:hypothetical protein
MAARTGMASIITELRGLCEAGTADYTVTSSTFWSDDQLQDILDIHRNDIIFEPLTAYPNVVSAGTNSWFDYRSSYNYYEATTGGTAIFYLQNAQGSIQGTSLYTADYRRGQFIFAADQRGTTYYLTGRSYDLDAAAADVWRRKAAHVAPTAFNFSTDNHSVSREAVYQHSLQMAEYFESKGSNAVESVQMYRSDLF